MDSLSCILICEIGNQVKKTDSKSTKESVKLEMTSVRNKSDNINQLIEEEKTFKSSISQFQPADSSKVNNSETKTSKNAGGKIANGVINFSPPIIKISLMNNEEIMEESSSLNSTTSNNPTGHIVIVATTPETTFYSDEFNNGNDLRSDKGEQKSKLNQLSL